MDGGASADYAGRWLFFNPSNAGGAALIFAT
jgi:hypothetical protein